MMAIFAFTASSCKDDGNKPKPSEPLDPEELVELITDTTWFDSCGCWNGTNNSTLNEIKVLFAIDTFVYVPYFPTTQDTLGVLIYEPNPDEELLKVLEMIGYSSSCYSAGLLLKGNFERYSICNFPGDKFKHIKQPCLFEMTITISGIIYSPSFEPPLSQADHERADLFLTSFKVARKYLLKGE